MIAQQMPRRRPPDRLDQILEAATRVFGRTGLENSKMSDVATEAGVVVEQPVFEGELEARGPPLARADHEVHRLVLGERRLLLALGRAGERLHRVAALDHHHRDVRRRIGEADRHRPAGRLRHGRGIAAASAFGRRHGLHAQVGFGDADAHAHADLVGQLGAFRPGEHQLERRAGLRAAGFRDQQPVGRLRESGAAEEKEDERQQPQAALQSSAPAKRSTRKSTNRRTFADRCLRLGYTA